MAEITGKAGAVYYRKGSIAAITIAFHENTPSADTITDSGNGFVAAGFEDDDKITVTGTVGNDGDYTIDTVAAGTLTLVAGDDLADEGVGTSFTIVESLPGTQLAGFFNWTISIDGEAHEVTDFQDSGNKTYLAGLKGWTATAEKHWMSEGNQGAWINADKTVRFFEVYDAAPNTTTVYYFAGDCIVSGIETAVPVGDVVTQTLTFTGDGALTATTRSTAWP